MASSIFKNTKNKSIILVGNSVEIMEHEHHEFIDSHDIVVHFGSALGATDKQKKSIGKRTDIWVTGQFRAGLFNKFYSEFKNGEYKNIKILLNRCRKNWHDKTWIIEDKLPNEMKYETMFSDKEMFEMMKELNKSTKSEYRFSAGFLTILFFIFKVKNYKSLSLIGFDFFAKSTKTRRMAPLDDPKIPGYVSKCDPHSWHMPLYTIAQSSHEMQFEQDYVLMLERRGLLKWHILSDLKKSKIKYTNWLNKK